MKKMIIFLLACSLLLIGTTAEARIRNRNVDKKAEIDLSKINITTDPLNTKYDDGNEFLHLPEVVTSSLPAAGTANEGGIVYDATTDTVKFSDGSSWTSVAATGVTLNSAYDAGAEIDIDAAGGSLVIDYNATGSVMTFDADTNSVTVTDCIKAATTGTSSVITDFIDASDADIVNALNFGANILLGSEVTIGGTTGSITINDDGDAGVFTVEGTSLDIDSLEFVAAGKIYTADSSALTLDAGGGNAAGEDLIITAHNIALTAVGKLSLTPDTSLAIAIDATDTDIVAALSVGANSILGTTGVIDYTHFDVNADGDVECVDLTASGTATLSNIALSSVAPASGDLTINAATGSNSITIGNLSTAGITISDNVAFGVTSLFSSGAGLGFRQATEVVASSTAGQLDIDANGQIELATAILDIDVTDNSDILVTGTDKSFTIATTDGDVVLNAVGGTNGDINIDAGNDVLIDAADIVSIGGGEASDFTTTAGDLTLQASAASVNINANEAAADQIKLNAQGATSGAAILLTTTQGQIFIDANNATDGDIILNSHDDTTLDATGLISLDAGAASNFTTSAGDLTLQATAASVTINANEAATNQIYLNAQGTIAGAAVTLTTTRGGITLDANHATDGDIVVNAASEFDFDAGTGISIVTATGDLAISTATQAVTCGDVVLTGGAATGGDGDGGDIILVAGDKHGSGTQGYIKLQDDMLVQTTEKIYFQDTGTFINSPSDGKIEIEADAGGADDIRLDGGVTVEGNLTLADNILGDGATELTGVVKDLVVATVTTCSIAQSGTVFYNTGAVQIELPEASAALGVYYTFVVLNAANFDINPDDADMIVGLCDVNGDMARSATLGDSITLLAVSASQWVVMSSSNTNASADSWVDGN